MKKRNIFLFILFFIILLLSCTNYETTVSSYNSYSYVISGVVKTSEGVAYKGATITLSNNSKSASITTDSLGNYSFKNLPTGSFTLTLTVPSDYVSDTTTKTVLLSGANSTNNNFIIKSLYSISGTVSTSTGEKYSGATVTLSGASSATTTTASDGTYSFPNLADGSYTVTLTVPDTYISSETEKHIILSGADSSGNDFTITKTYSISGVLKKSIGGVYSGATIVLSGPTIDTIVAGEDGSYSFTVTQNGDYTITVLLPEDKTETITVKMENNNTTGNDITITVVTYTISGNVTTSTGSKYQNATLTLFDSSSTALSSDTTDANGSYSFAGIEAGTYTVKLTVPNNYTATTTTKSVTLSNADSTGNDFTITEKTYTVSGAVNISPSGASYNNGATLTLYNSSANSIASTTSTSDGSYSFIGLVAGNYTVKLTNPSGYFSKDTTLSITISNANITGQNFTIWEYHTVSGKVTGHSNDTLRLSGNTNANTVFADTTVTDGSGNYSFNAIDGNYTLTLTIPSTYIADDTTETITISGGNITKDFNLTPTYTISGNIKLNGSNFTGSADVTISGGSLTVNKTITTTNGAYSFSGLTTGNYTVTLSTPSGYYCANTTINISSLSANTPDQDFTLAPTYSIGGTITGYSSETVTVTLTDYANNQVHQATPNGNGGTYTFAGLIKDSTYTITLTIPDNYIADDTTETYTVTGPIPKNFKLTPVYSISGKVNISPSGTYNGATLTLYNSSADSIASITSTSDGSYSFSGLEAGNYIVTLSTPNGYYSANTTINVSLLSGNIPNQDFTIWEYHTVSGKVTGHSNDTLRLSGNTNAGTFFADTTATDGSGNYSFKAINGTYDLTLTIPENYIADDTIETITISGSDVAKNFNLTPTYTISGNVKLDGSNFTGSADVTISGGSLTTNKTIPTTNGAYFFSGLVAGNYTVTLSTPSNYYSADTTINVSSLSGDIPNQDFTIWEYHTVSGKVSGHGSDTIRLSGNTNAGTFFADTTVTDGSGNYSFKAINGTYDLTLTIPENYIADDTTATITISGGNVTKDFYLTPIYSISGNVKLNGSNFTGSANVTISGGSLTANKTIPTTNGAYFFSGLVAGNYTVTLSTPSNYYSADTTINVSSLSGDIPNQDFTIWEYHTVSGKVTGHSNDTLRLSGNTNAGTFFADTTVTDGSGNYSFKAINGTYDLTLTIPENYIADDTTKSITVNNADSTNNNFNLTQTYNISGTVTAPANNDEKIANATLTLSFGGNQIATATTDINGEYKFSGVLGSSTGNTYTITLSTPSDYFVTDSAPTTIIYSNDKTINFTLWKKYTVSGKVTGHGNDTVRLSGTTTILTDFADTTVTDENGNYSFKAINGTYNLTLTIPENYIAVDTTKSIPIDNADSTGNDFTLIPTYSILGKVNILSGSNTSDYTDGAYLTLYNSSADSIASTTSIGDGSYSFSGLVTGDYTVKLTNPTGYFTKDTTLSITISNDNVTGQNFTIQKTYSIKGSILNYGGVTLTLSGDSSATLTGVSGNYSFDGLVSGKYHVTIDIPEDWIANDTTLDIDINEADSTGNDFTLTQTYFISGEVSNGATGEKYENATLKLYFVVPGVSKDSVATTTTASDGSYKFSGITTTGSYEVRLTTPSGYYAPTTTISVSLTSSNISWKNFAIWKYHTVSGKVTGHGSDTLRLSGTSNTSPIVDFNDTVTTDANGDYAFNVLNGSYNVTLTIPNSYIADDTTKSITVSNADSTNNNFNLTPTYSISGKVSTVTGATYKGATITLSGSSNKTTTTGDRGIYSFSGLLAGTYTVALTVPTDYDATTATSLSSIAVNTTNGDSTGNNFTIRMTIPAITIEDLRTKIANGENVEKVNTSEITDMSRLFKDNGNFDQNISNWDVSRVKDMSFMFYGDTLFNQDLSNWKVDSVTNMSNMFTDAKAFNGDISGWDVSKVTDMTSMFCRAQSFNADITGWTVSSVKNMRYMFFENTTFNQEIGGWDVSNVEDMGYMFGGDDTIKCCKAFNQNLNNWNVSKVKAMDGMFKFASSFNGKISNWDVSNDTTMCGMFFGATAFNDSIGNWGTKTSNVNDMSYMFYQASSFNQDISSWDVGKVTTMAAMFRETPFNQDIGGWNVINVKDMSSLFYGNTAFNGNIGNWKEKTANVENMSWMFTGARGFDQDISDWNLSKVNNMEYMFNGASIFNQNLINWNTWTQFLPTPPGFDTNANAWLLANKPAFSN